MIAQDLAGLLLPERQGAGGVGGLLVLGIERAGDQCMSKRSPLAGITAADGR